MELSVYLNEVCCLEDTDEDNYRIVDEYPELIYFKDYIVEKDIEYYDLEKTVNNLGYKLEDLNLDLIINDCIFIFRDWYNNEVKIQDPLTHIENKKCIYYKQKDYISDSVNYKVIDDPFIVDLNTLNKHLHNYFYNSKEYKAKVINNFIEGKTFVYYG